MNTYSLRHLCEDVDVLITALDGSPYATHSLTNPTWRPAKQAITEAVGSALDQHLLFSTTVENAPATGNAGPDYYEVEADLVVSFMFKLGGDVEIARERLAMDAAADVVSALMSRRTARWSNIEPNQPFTPGRKVGDFLPVEVRMRVRMDIGYNFH